MREKFTCRDCERFSKAPAPFHVLLRGWAGPSPDPGWALTAELPCDLKLSLFDEQRPGEPRAVLLYTVLRQDVVSSLEPILFSLHRSRRRRDSWRTRLG